MLLYQKAADILTPSISETVQDQLAEPEYSNSYLMLKKLKKQYAPINEQAFINAYQELFQLSSCNFNTFENWMTQIKVFNEHIVVGFRSPLQNHMILGDSVVGLR